MARTRGPGPRPKPKPTEQPKPQGEARVSYKQARKVLTTPGLQKGEKAIIDAVVAKRGVSRAEARKIAARRAAAGKNVGGIRSAAHPLKGVTDPKPRRGPKPKARPTTETQPYTGPRLS